MNSNESIKNTCFIDIINSSNELELIISINNALKQVISKGIRFSKSELIKCCREKKTMYPNIWTRKVAQPFGTLLKQIKRYEKLCELRETNTQTPTSESALHCFGTFYDTVRYNNTQISINFSKVSCGGTHIIALSHDNKIYTWGTNSFGQLGNGSYQKQQTPSIITISTNEYLDINCKYISAGYSTSSFITESGRIYSCGATSNGRLGIENDPKDTTCNIPTKVKHDFIATKICSGSTNQIALSNDRQIYTWGSKYYCGFNTDVDILYPTKILGDIKFNDIAIGVGGYHIITLSLAGNIYTWGHNEVGQLGFGVGEGTSQNEFQEPCYELPTMIEDTKNILIKSISGGWGHSAILSFAGNVYMCGRNIRGQVGFDPLICKKNKQQFPYIGKFTLLDGLVHENIDKVVCGGEHSAAITKEGKLYLWGDNSCHQLCTHSNEYTYIPEKVVEFTKVSNVILGSTSTFIQI